MSLFTGSNLRRGVIGCIGLLAGLIAGPVQAQSYNEVMSDLSAQQFYADVQRRISSGIDDGPSFQTSQRYEMTPELAQALEEERALEAEQRAELARLQADPEFMRHVEGFWEFYQSREAAPPGEYCAATYTNTRGKITLTGVDRSWNGGLLVFFGEGIPSTDAFREITVTLTQTGERPARVRVYNPNAIPEMHGLGTIIFAVPDMEAALSGLGDEQDFAIAIDGEEVFNMGWKDADSARDSLRECMRARN